MTLFRSIVRIDEVFTATRNAETVDEAMPFDDGQETSRTRAEGHTERNDDSGCQFDTPAPQRISFP